MEAQLLVRRAPMMKQTGKTYPMRLAEQLKNIRPVREALALVTMALVVLAWMFRYEGASAPYRVNEFATPGIYIQ